MANGYCFGCGRNDYGLLTAYHGCISPGLFSIFCTRQCYDIWQKENQGWPEQEGQRTCH